MKWVGCFPTRAYSAIVSQMRASGHLIVGVEVVVSETSRYQVVEKIGAATPVSARLNPRGATIEQDAA
jgi:hypothetical protein